MTTSWWYISNITSFFFNLLSKAKTDVNLKQNGKQEEGGVGLRRTPTIAVTKAQERQSALLTPFLPPPPKLAIVSYRTKTCTG